jgi:DNA replication protein DnaC
VAIVVSDEFGGEFMKRLFGGEMLYLDGSTIVAPAVATDEKAHFEYLGHPEHEKLMLMAPNNGLGLAGKPFQESLESHSYWGRFPSRWRPKGTAEISDRGLMSRAEGWLTRQQIISDANPNPPILKLANVPVHLWPPEYQQKCQRCDGLGSIITKRWQAGHTIKRVTELCPDCEFPRRQQEKRLNINQRWPLLKGTEDFSKKRWLKKLPDSTPAMQISRRAQREIIKEMPTGKTLFLYGKAGVGKTRLLAEIATAARPKLSAIFRTIENIRSIVQNFPASNDAPQVKAEKQRRLALASKDLRDCDVLIIDELDDAIGSAIWKTLLDILSHRMSSGLTTCFAANGSPQKYLTSAIKSRLFADGNLTVNLLKETDKRRHLGY